MPTSPASEAISAKLPVSFFSLGLSESRSLIPFRMNEGETSNKNATDRCQNQAGLCLSLFGLG